MGATDKFKTSKNTFTAPLLVFVVMALSVLVRYIDVSMLEFNTGDNIYLSIIVIQIMVFVLPAAFYCKIKGDEYVLRLNMRFVSPSKAYYTVICFFTLLSGAYVIKLILCYMGLYTSAGELIFSTYGAATLLSGSPSVVSFIYLIVTFAVIPAITEEFLFRGVVLREYSDSGGGAVCAVLFSALLSGMYHFHPDTMVLYIFMGIVLAVLVYVTRSLLAAVIVHTLYKTCNLLFEGYFLRLIEKKENYTILAFLFITVFLFMLTLLWGESERIYYNDAIFDTENKNLPVGIVKNENKFLSFALGDTVSASIAYAALSPSFILCAALFIAGSYFI